MSARSLPPKIREATLVIATLHKCASICKREIAPVAVAVKEGAKATPSSQNDFMPVSTLATPPLTLTAAPFIIRDDDCRERDELQARLVKQ